MASTKPPRKHHYISQFLLSGFTADGTQDGLLYVSDLKEKKCWPASGTANAGHKRDLYELDIEGIVGLDPMAAEKGLAVIEGRTAAILNSMKMQPSAMLSQEDLRQILYFIALQVGRVPGERPRVEEAYGRLESALETPESWEAERQRRSLNSLEYSYDELRSQMGTQSMQTLFVLTMIAAADVLLPVLAKRAWGLLVASGGSLICSDRPVVTITRGVPPHPTRPGRIADMDLDLLVPLHAELCLFGTKPSGPIPSVTSKLVATLNTCVARAADRFLFSREQDFIWIRPDGSDGRGLEQFVVQAWPPLE